MTLWGGLLDIYANDNTIVYDPFNGTGTTGVGCIKRNLTYYGSEISEAQCEYTINRLKDLTNTDIELYKL